MIKTNNAYKRIALILLFYLINFGLWELIASVISDEWASLMVYVMLFIFIIFLFNKELKESWMDIRSTKLTSKRYYLELIIVLLVDLILGLVVIKIAQSMHVDILPVNNENVKSQMNTVPIFLSVIQGCIFAPVIEEMTFRYGIIGNHKSKYVLFATSFISIILFECIHIVKVLEFFYYISTSVILTLFYIKHSKVFKRYIKLINIYHIDNDSDYYQIGLNDKGYREVITVWVGYDNMEKGIEIRKPREISGDIVEKAIDFCASVKGRPIVINSKEDVEIFYLYGGPAIVKKEICEKYMSEFAKPIVGPSPEREVMRKYMLGYYD